MRDRFENMLSPNHCSFLFIAKQFGWPACDGGLQRHHVLNRTLLNQNTEALRLVEKVHDKMFIRWVCAKHNRDRFADSKRGRQYLLNQFPPFLVVRALNEINACYEEPVYRPEALGVEY